MVWIYNVVMFVMFIFEDLCCYVVVCILFKLIMLLIVIWKLGFVQVDLIWVFVCVQDLILWYWVKYYCVGDFEWCYSCLLVEEDCLVNYGFLFCEYLVLMYLCVVKCEWDVEIYCCVVEVLVFVCECGSVYLCEVDQVFVYGCVINYWGGISNVSMYLLDGMYYCGLLCVVWCDNGICIYVVVEYVEVDVSEQLQFECVVVLIDLVVCKYVLLLLVSLIYLVWLLGYGVFYLVEQICKVLVLVKQQLVSCMLEGIIWYWLVDENLCLCCYVLDEQVCLLVLFDLVVWDCCCFELLWGWVYKFEVYMFVLKCQYGYYVLLVLWYDQVVGWVNLSVCGGELVLNVGYVGKLLVCDKVFCGVLDDELQCMVEFLQC